MLTISEQAIEALANVITGTQERSPYRRGMDLIKFFNKLGWSDESLESPSRYKYAEGKLQAVNGTARLEEVIRATFEPRHFLNSGVDIQETVDYVNEYLVFDGYAIVEDGLFYKVQRLPGTAKQGSLVKNIIFASIGPKPKLVLQDATTNDIRIVEGEDRILVYDREIGENGLLWNGLLDWWVDHQGIAGQSRKAQGKSLIERLAASLGDNEAELSLFYTYVNVVSRDTQGKLPALIPQVYLHYDPYTVKQLRGQKNLERQRMDFLLLLPNHVKIVIEIDGKQHYSVNNVATPRLYAEMVAEDRRLKLSGYEVFRFGGFEFTTSSKEEIITSFFQQLFEIHSVF